MSGCQLFLEEAAQAIEADLFGENLQFAGVSTDSRSIQPGQLFVALTGPNFDGHDYAAKAVDSGASCVLVESQLDVTVPQLVVKDSLKALGRLGAYWRRKLAMLIVAVTGSNGKTTVKEMLASILSQTGETFATRGNLNNDIGVPLTLLSLEQKHQTAVVELGANHLGEIAYLTNLTAPDVAVVNNAAAAHLEGFGSLDGVANAKGEIFQGLQGKGRAVINVDDPYAQLWHSLASPNKVTTFGMQNEADVTCHWQWADQGMELNISTPVGEVSCELKLIGRHNVMNALAATAAAIAANTPLVAIKSGLQAMRPVPGRLQLKQGINGSKLIDDTYNANPSSLKAALEVLSHFEGKKILALGDMGELGEGAEQLHFEAGERSRELNLNQLCAIGKNSQRAVNAFGENGRHYASHEAMIEYLAAELDEKSVLLIKGSRSMRMERIVDGLSYEQ